MLFNILIKEANMIIRRSYCSIFIIITLAFTIFAGGTVLAENVESDSASTIRLVHYEGDVTVENEDGSAGFLMENMRFDSGQALVTAAESTASVSLDDSKILSMDEESRVEFEQEGRKLGLTLTEGTLFLDVKEKLDENESLDIQTSTMAVGIRGTIVYATDVQAPDSELGRISTIGILEGVAQVSYTDGNGGSQQTDVPAGQKLVLVDSDLNGRADSVPEITNMTAADISAFVEAQINSDTAIQERVINASDVLERTDDVFSADGDWTWDQPVTLVAQSASKLYDGAPLTRRSDVLVYGLPTDFSISAAAGGSQTDAGTANNPVSSYKIYNSHNEDVTSHFKKIETVDGKLRVDPAPLTIWTAGATKVYDGTPLTDPETQLRTVPGYDPGEPLWRDTAYVQTASAGTEILYGVCGTTWVHGTNPLTEEVREIELPAGKKLTVYLNDEDGKQSIEFRIEDMTEEEIPEELLRLYADNPDLRVQACKDTGWDEESIVKRIDELQEDNSPKTEQSDLTINESATDRLMQDSTNVKIHIDTTITNYNGRALGNEEAHYTPVRIDPSIKLTATGSQTEVGQSPNTYEIVWGNANPNNYIVEEELGTLTVTAAPLTVMTGSAEKEFDGEALTDSEASLTGLVNGETATVTATGSRTEEGTSANTYSISWGTAKSSNYSITENLGTLKVTAKQKEKTYDDEVTLTSDSAEKYYDGTALTDSGVKAKGLPDGFTVKASASGSQTDAGSSTNTISSYTIYDADGKDVTDKFTNVTKKEGTLTVNPLPVEFTIYCPPEGIEYQGYSIIPEAMSGIYPTRSDEEVEIEGDGGDTVLDDEERAVAVITTFNLIGGGQVEMTLTGYKDVGTYTVTPEILFKSGKESNYEFSYKDNTLEIIPLAIEFDLASEGYAYANGKWHGNQNEVTGTDGYGTIPRESYTVEEGVGRYVFCPCGEDCPDRLILELAGYKDPGEYTLVPTISFSPGNADNYDISWKNDSLVIQKIVLTLTPECEVSPTSDGETVITLYRLFPDFSCSLQRVEDGEYNRFVAIVDLSDYGLDGTANIWVRINQPEKTGLKTVITCKLLSDTEIPHQEYITVVLEKQEIDQVDDPVIIGGSDNDEILDASSDDESDTEESSETTSGEEDGQQSDTVVEKETESMTSDASADTSDTGKVSKEDKEDTDLPQETDPAKKTETEKVEPDKKVEPEKTEPTKKVEPETKPAASSTATEKPLAGAGAKDKPNPSQKAPAESKADTGKTTELETE